MKSYLKNILVASSLLIAMRASSRDLYFESGILKSTSTHTILTGDTVGISVPAASGAADYNVKNIISLKLDQNSPQYLAAATVLRAKVTVTRWDRYNHLISPDRTENLIVSVDNRYNKQTIDLSSLKLEGGYRLKVTLDSLIINGVATDSLPPYAYIESEIFVTRYFDFSGVVDDTISDLNITALNTDCDDVIADELQLNWGTIAEAEEYQLEWVYINNYGIDSTTFISPGNLEVDFRNNSTRITTTDNTYRVSLVYEKGYLAFRVRAVGRDTLNPKIYMYGAWSEPDKETISSVSSGSKYHILDAHENKKNWQYSSTFAEGGKKKEIISYFDGSLHNRQSVTKVNSDKNVIVGETLYDYQGRPAVNVLPAPVNYPVCDSFITEPALKYYRDFNVNASGNAYSKSDFDQYDTTNPCVPVIPGMDTTSGASQYYSGNNPDKSFQQAYLPNAELFPFSQVEYTPDNTGRIRSQSGVGKTFQLGSGHETKYIYSQPNQVEIDRLFGSEAGDATHYKKNTVIDANGQTSISYLNQEGKTVATALAGNAPADSTTTYMSALASEAAGTDTLSIDLFNKNSSGISLTNKITPLQDGIEFSTVLGVSYRSNYKFNYDLSVSSYSDSCMKENICMSCIYDLEIKISDECGVNLVSPAISKRVGHLDTIPDGFTMTCTDPSGSEIHDSVTLNLYPGSYTVSKVLTINKDARAYYVKKYLDTTYNACHRTLGDFLSEQIAAMDTTSCYTSCSACAAALGTKADFLSSGKGTELQYDLLYEQCLEPCKEEDLCETSFKMMLADVSPGGQYAKFNDSSETSTDQLSLLNTANSLNKNQLYPGSQTWKRPLIKINGNTYGYYLDENGNRLKVYLSPNDTSGYYPEVSDTLMVFTDATTGGKFTFPENLKYLKDFLAKWNPHFAYSLVMYHPEYAYYTACSSHHVRMPGDTMSSNQFDSLMLATNTFQEAVTNGFIKNNYDSTTVNPLDKLTNWLNAGGHLFDPFVTNPAYGMSFSSSHGMSVSYSHTKIYLYMHGMLDTSALVAGLALSLPELAAFEARSGSNYTALPTAATLNFGTDFYPTTTANTTRNDSIRDLEWSYIKKKYLSFKRMVQFDRMDFYASYYNWSNNLWRGGCNVCMSAHGALDSYRMHYPNDLFASPRAQMFNWQQPCSIYTKSLYANCQKRFLPPSQLPGVTLADIPYLVYQQTGQCPMTFMFQSFMNELAQDSVLNSAANVNLSTIANYGPDMYTAFSGGATPSAFVDYYWDYASTTSGVLTADIKEPGTGFTKCTITLDINGSAISSIGQIIGLQSLTYDTMVVAGVYKFKATAVYLIGDTATAFTNINGSTTLNIKDCNFKPECTGNQFAADYSELITAVNQFGHLTSSAYNISSDSLINPFISPVIKNMLGVPHDHLMWSYPSSSTYEIYDSLNPGTKLRMTELSLAPSISSGAIAGFSNIRSNYNNLFKMDIIDTTNISVAVFDGKMEKIIDSVVTGISMGDCSLPDAPECTTTEHNVRKDLEKLISEFLISDSLSTLDLFHQVNFSLLLQSYLPDTVMTAGTLTGMYLSDTSAVNNYDTLTFNWNNGCNFQLYHNIHDTNAVAKNFADLIAVTDLTGALPMDASGNYHNFYCIGTYHSGSSYVNDTIHGSSCWPLRNCHSCDSTTITPAPLDSSVVSIPFTYDGWAAPTTIDAVDSSACDSAYSAFVNVVHNYNLSAYAAAHTDTLDENIIPTAELFIQSGYCGCNYISYLQAYIDSSATYPYPVPGDINHYSGCTHISTYGSSSLCHAAYLDYLTAINSYNSFSKPRPDTYPSIPSSTVPTEEVFTGRYCNCVQKYIAGITAVINGYNPGYSAVSDLIDLDNSCATVACVAAAPDSAFIFPAAIYSPNACVQQMLNIAALNAQNLYGQYVDSVNTSISKRYTEHCLDALEEFRYNYTDKEYHYTLYYYDQAGNLVKTVPPEGVKLLDIDSSTDALEVQIIKDRENGTQTVFTDHRMPTNYEYNSLNQLVAQDMPDHDKMSMIDFTLPNGLDSRIKIQRTQFVNSNKGFLTGSTGGKGYLYTTDNGGNNWTRIYNYAAGDLNAVSFGDANTGFAVGDDGIILKTTNAGGEWITKNLHSVYQENFYSVYFSSATSGVIGGVKTATRAGLFYTTDGGTNYVADTSFAVGDTITSITNDGSNYYATVKNNGSGKIYKSADAHAWNEMKQMRANDLTRARYLTTGSGVIAYAAGKDGTLLKTPLNSTGNWQLAATGTSRAFMDVYFSTENNGVALLDSAGGKGQIYKTFDGGKSWELLSTPGDYYTSFQNYNKTTLLACGDDGLIAKVYMSIAPFGMSKMKQPSLVNDLRSADAVIYLSNPQIVAVGSNDTIYYTENGGVSDHTWTPVKTSTAGVSSGDANYKKVLVKDTTGSSLKGILLTQTGKLYALNKDTSDVFSFSIAAVKDLGGTAISSYFFNDITMDTHVSSAFYAYDTISRRAFRGSITGTAATFSYMDTVTAQQKGVQSIAADSSAGNFVMVGTQGIIKYKSSPNSGSGTYSNRSFRVKLLPLNSISAKTDNVLYAAGNDGTVWGSFEGSTWKLLNSGITENINAIKIKADSTVGALACNNGKLYRQSASDTVSISLTATDLGTEENLTTLALNDTVIYAGTSGGQIFSLPSINSSAYSNLNVVGMSGSFSGMDLPPGADQVIAVGEGATIYGALGISSMRINSLFTPAIAAMSFYDANNGYIASTKSDIRHTSDGGNTWSVIVPDVVPLTMTNLYATKSNQAVLIGSDKYLSVVNGDSQPDTVTVVSGASTVDLFALDFNKSTLRGVIGGEQRNVYTLSPTGNAYAVTYLGQTTAGSPTDYKFVSAKVFSDNSFLIAGEQSKIWYYNGSTFTSQMNDSGLIASPASQTINDIYFHDDRTGYVAGTNGIVLKCTLTGNIMSGTGATTDAISWDTLSVSDPFGIYNSSTKTTINISSIDFVDRHHGFLGGFYNTNPTNANYSMLIDDNSNYYSTRFFYDRLGRMVVSQNTKQFSRSPKAYSYTCYDVLGRIKEVGEKTENTDSIPFRKIFGSDVGGMFNSNTIDNDSLEAWVTGDGARKEVTRTYYDTTVFNNLPMTQENLRKRVSDVTYEDVNDNVDSTYQHATHYTYDIHGNVSTLVQDNPMVNVSTQRYKRIDYEYDLISGKVNRVIYQPDAPDLFIHRYEYDDDNRITRVETSTDDVIYQTDAKYFYYAHGPLARVELGKNQVQGLDYAYTLQGWIKGVNSNTLKSSRDMGQDGLKDTNNLNEYFAEDAFGYTLGYYKGDYKAIDRLKWNTVANRFEAQTTGAQFEGERHDLYNGNISHMVTTIAALDTAGTGLVNGQTALPLANAYKYDQLNRLKSSLSFNNIDIPNNLWNASGQTVAHMYENVFTYDGNGNILTQKRADDAGVTFDSLQYKYKRDVSGNLMQNRLYHVNDPKSAGLQADDIDDEGAFDSTLATMNTVNNYRYDQIGNLIADSTEQIDTITWTVYGKIKEIKRKAGSPKKNLKFEYDASGNRIAKQVLSSAGVWENTTYYVRDAQGNVMSTYDERSVSSSFSFKLKEVDLYGSARLGMFKPDKEMIDADTTNEFAFDTLNKREYELSTHLGNVTTVSFDRKIGVDTNSDGIIDRRFADLASVSDYSPFGSKLYHRGGENSKYPMSFNGKRDDSETGTQDYGLRIYNPALGKFLSIDPLTRKYPHYTPYQFAGNKPIRYTDLDGAEENDSKGGIKNGNGKASSLAVDNTATIVVPASVANYKDSGSSPAPLVNVSSSSDPSTPPKSEEKPKAEQIKEAGEYMSTAGAMGEVLKVGGIEKVGEVGEGMSIGANLYTGITAPVGSKEESDAKTDVATGVATYLAPRLGVPYVGEALLIKDLVSPILDLPNNPEVQGMVLEQLKKAATTGDLKDKQNYEDYYKKVVPFKPPVNDAKVGPPQ